jgi:hypothetical protein
MMPESNALVQEALDELSLNRALLDFLSGFARKIFMIIAVT